MSTIKDILDQDLKIGDRIMLFGREIILDSSDMESIKNANKAFDILHTNPGMQEKAFEEVYTRAVR